MNLPSPEKHTAQETTPEPLSVLLRAVDHTVNAKNEPDRLIAIMHLNNAAQYLRTVRAGTAAGSATITESTVIQDEKADRVPVLVYALKQAKDVIQDAKEIANTPDSFSRKYRAEFLGQCTDVIEHIEMRLKEAEGSQ